MPAVTMKPKKPIYRFTANELRCENLCFWIRVRNPLETPAIVTSTYLKKEIKFSRRTTRWVPFSLKTKILGFTILERKEKQSCQKSCGSSSPKKFLRKLGIISRLWWLCCCVIWCRIVKLNLIHVQEGTVVVKHLGSVLLRCCLDFWQVACAGFCPVVPRLHQLKRDDHIPKVSHAPTSSELANYESET